MRGMNPDEGGHTQLAEGSNYRIKVPRLSLCRWRSEREQEVVGTFT